MGRPVHLGTVAALASFAALPVATGCGAEPPVPLSCLQAQPVDLMRALHTAPTAVRLRDGTLLSQCIDRAEDDADLQTLGPSFVQAADRLAAQSPASDAAAFQLGFLIGAAERGAGPAGGTQGELIDRLQQRIVSAPERPGMRDTVKRGIVAGKQGG